MSIKLFCSKELSCSWLVVPTYISIIIFELLIIIEQKELALFGHTVLLIVGFVFILRNQESTSVLRPLLFLPVFRLVSYGTPEYPESIRIFIIYLLLIPPLAMMLHDNHDQPRLLYSKFQNMLILSFIIIYSIVTAFSHLWIPPQNPEIFIKDLGGSYLLFTAAVFLGSLFEEILFRGLIFRSLASYYGLAAGLLLSSLLNGIVYSPLHSFSTVLLASGAGVILGSLLLLSGSLASTILINFFFNIIFLFYEYI